MDLFGKSIKGRRKENQDSILFKSQNGCFLLAVADGLGGTKGGKIASKIAIKQSETCFENFCLQPETKKLKTTINDICTESQKDIKTHILQNPNLKNMGTTLTVILGYNKKYVIGNIGDSRAYLFKSNMLQQITKDNSYIREYKEKYQNDEIDSYIMTKLSHIVTKAISNNDDKIDIYPHDSGWFDLKPNDILMVCSDGLIIDKSLQPGDKFIEILNNYISIREKTEQLVQLAYDEGSLDNVSVVLGKVMD